MNRKFIKLKKFWHSSNDYSHHKTFGAADLSTLPAELLFLSPVLDQGQTPSCSAYASVGVRDSMKSKQYDPQIQWSEEQQFCDSSLVDGVSDIRIPMAVGIKTGFAPLGTPVPTEKASAYFSITPNNGLDLFDSIRSAINQVQSPVLTALMWYEEWDLAPGGFLTPTYLNVAGGHCIKIAGWKTVGCFGQVQPVLILQNSWGSQAGDQGMYYMTRDEANRCLTYGTFYWTDTANVQVQTLGLINALWVNIISLLQKL